MVAVYGFTFGPEAFGLQTGAVLLGPPLPVEQTDVIR